MKKLLTGVRVLDFGRYVAGPYCASLLAYLGAEVIRIEKSSGGEDRYIAPFPGLDAGALFMQTGCNKHSLALDFRNPLAHEAVQRLLKTADVVVVNLPGVQLRKMGLDWETVHETNPRTILSTQTAFGSHGPLAQSGGFDGVAQAMSGAMYMSGTPGQPVKAAAPYVDYSTAVLAAFGVLAALMDREKTGLGQHVQGSLLATALSVFSSHLIEQSSLESNRAPSGNRVQTSGPSDVFATRDGHVLTHVVGQGIFQRCASLLQKHEWLEDPALANDQGRGDARDLLCENMAAWCSDKTTSEALALLEAAGIPAGPVLDLQEALAHPQVQAMDFLSQVIYPGMESASSVPDLPLSFSQLNAGISSPPPQLGQHNQEILTSLGFSADEINMLAPR